MTAHCNTFTHTLTYNNYINEWVGNVSGSVALPDPTSTPNFLDYIKYLAYSSANGTSPLPPGFNGQPICQEMEGFATTIYYPTDRVKQNKVADWSANQRVGQLVSHYPNPAQGIVYFSGGNQEEISLKVLDITGRQMIEIQNIKPENGLDISQLKAGTYQLMLKVGSRWHATKLVVL